MKKTNINITKATNIEAYGNHTKGKTKKAGLGVSRNEMAEFRKWKAERKAEEMAQKRKEKREAEKVKLQAYIQKHTLRAEKAMETWDTENKKIMRAEQKLEALMDKEVNTK